MMLNLNNLKQTLYLKGFSLFNIPMLFLANPSIVKLSPAECEVLIPLNWLTKNHLHSMYFGVLAMGADLACGLMAMEHIRRSGEKLSLIFKNFKSDFLKRAESDVHFTCKEGRAIEALVKKALKTGERQNESFEILAFTSKKTEEIVAKFELTLSLKAQNSRHQPLKINSRHL